METRTVYFGLGFPSVLACAWVRNIWAIAGIPRINNRHTRTPQKMARMREKACPKYVARNTQQKVANELRYSDTCSTQVPTCWIFRLKYTKMYLLASLNTFHCLQSQNPFVLPHIRNAWVHAHSSRIHTKLLSEQFCGTLGRWNGCSAAVVLCYVFVYVVDGRGADMFADDITHRWPWSRHASCWFTGYNFDIIDIVVSMDGYGTFAQCRS